MLKYIVFTLLLLCGGGVHGQVPEPAMLWLKGYGGNGGDIITSNVTKTADNGFVICLSAISDSGTGNIDSFCLATHGSNIFMKYNSDASVLEWTRCNVYGDYIYPINSNKYIYGGNARWVPSGWAFYIFGEDSAGNVLWQKTYGGDTASAILHAMCQVDDGGFVMAGVSYYTDTDFTTHYGGWGADDIAVLKVDTNGNKLWSRVLGGSSVDIPAAVVPAPVNGVYIVGGTSSTDYDCTASHGGTDIFLERMGKDGSTVWRKLIGGSGNENCFNAVSDGKGGVLIAGASNSYDGDDTAIHAATGCPIWIVDVDSNGHVVWNNCFGGGGGNCYPQSICRAADGSIWVGGVSSINGWMVDTNYGRNDAFYLHLSSSGDFISSKVLGSSAEDRAQLVYGLSNNTVLVAGFFDQANGCFNISFHGNLDAFLGALAPWTTEINSKYIESTVKIYPNPAKEDINIETGNFTGSVELYNMVGQKLYVTNMENKSVVALQPYPPGSYLIRLVKNAETIYTHTFIKE